MVRVRSYLAVMLSLILLVGCAQDQSTQDPVDPTESVESGNDGVSEEDASDRGDASAPEETLDTDQQEPEGDSGYRLVSDSFALTPTGYYVAQNDILYWVAGQDATVVYEGSGSNTLSICGVGPKTLYLLDDGTDGKSLLTYFHEDGEVTSIMDGLSSALFLPERQSLFYATASTPIKLFHRDMTTNTEQTLFTDTGSPYLDKADTEFSPDLFDTPWCLNTSMHLREEDLLFTANYPYPSEIPYPHILRIDCATGQILADSEDLPWVLEAGYRKLIYNNIVDSPAVVVEAPVGENFYVMEESDQEVDEWMPKPPQPLFFVEGSERRMVGEYRAMEFATDGRALYFTATTADLYQEIRLYRAVGTDVSIVYQPPETQWGWCQVKEHEGIVYILISQELTEAGGDDPQVRTALYRVEEDYAFSPMFQIDITSTGMGYSVASMDFGQDAAYLSWAEFDEQGSSQTHGCLVRLEDGSSVSLQ